MAFNKIPFQSNTTSLLSCATRLIIVVKVLVFPAISCALIVKELSPNMRGTSVNVNLPALSAPRIPLGVKYKQDFLYKDLYIFVLKNLLV